MIVSKNTIRHRRVTSTLIAGFLLLNAGLLTGCGSLREPVKPWQKGNLAKWHMTLTPDPLEARYLEHVYFSKEGMSGGYGVGGGGCGCN